MQKPGSLYVFVLFSLMSPLAFGQAAATLKGTVTLSATNGPLQHATVRIIPPGRNAETNEEGIFEFRDLPPGVYTVIAHMHDLTDESKHVVLEPGGTATVDFRLHIATLKQEVTVTASGHEQTALETFQTVTALDGLELAQKSESSLGEVLENEPGVAKRSFGPGSSRPVIRGFDGDRVLIMQDGLPTGTISSQSGDHGESIDASSLDSVEVVKGPSTLLYGSNAIGGVVNAITGHHQVHQHAHQGLRGNITMIGGSNNGHAGGSGGFEYGTGPWLIWGDGSAQRTGDYSTPLGTVRNSATRISNSSGGVGWYGPKKFLSAGYGYDEGRYGVPFAGSFEGGGEEGEKLINLDFRRHHVRLQGGLLDMQSFVDSLRLSLSYTDWEHRELANNVPGTVLRNRQVIYRGVFEQRRRGDLSGSFGFSGVHRNYRSLGEEALSPPVAQDGGAVFGLEEVGFERFRLQFGGRVENNRYAPRGLRNRSFTGFSGAAGINIPLWKGGAFVTNYSYSYRPPALEELYNLGPHVGNLTYEIGNPDLGRERSGGFDVSVRHEGRRMRAEANFFRYDIRDFVYLAPTGAIEEGLVAAEYRQGNSRFMGGEVGLDLSVHPNLWLNLGTDYVNAQLKRPEVPLPRIPPLRGRAGCDFRYNGFSFKPELLLANAQDRIFLTETRTGGYAVLNLGTSYMVARQHLLHVISFHVFNATDRLYRNHLSFIKDLAPEIGRGLRVTYTVRFF